MPEFTLQRLHVHLDLLHFLFDLFQSLILHLHLVHQLPTSPPLVIIDFLQPIDLFRPALPFHPRRILPDPRDARQKRLPVTLLQRLPSEIVDRLLERQGMLALGPVGDHVTVFQLSAPETDEIPVHRQPVGDGHRERLGTRMKRERIDLEHVPLERSPLVESESSMGRQGDSDPRVVDVKVPLSFDTPVGIVLLPEMTVSIGITVFQGSISLDDLWINQVRREEDRRDGLFFLVGNLLVEPVSESIALRGEERGVWIERGMRGRRNDVDSRRSEGHRRELQRVGPGKPWAV